MFYFTLIPSFKITFLKPLPFIANTILISAVFSPLYFPSYYDYQPILYSIDLAMAVIVYNYLFYKYLNWTVNSCFEHTSVNKINENVSISFYVIFMLYWLYDGIVQFIYNTKPDILFQLGNILMFTAWYLYYSICSLLYYFICIKLAQRTQAIKNWLKNVKRSRPVIEEFYKEYKVHHRAIKEFSKHWNFIICMGFIILTYHIPIDLINIIYNKYYIDVPGLIVKSSALGWYTYQICALNDLDTNVISYLYKHDLYNTDEMERIKQFGIYNELGLNFYGIKIDGSFILKYGLLIINFIIPTVYALISNNIVGSSR